MIRPVTKFRAMTDEPAQAEMTMSGPEPMVRAAYESLTGGPKVVVDRACFERLRELAQAASDVYDSAPKPITHETRHLYDRLADAVEALLPTDTDPRPEE